uniref:Uncharacterized protein n=1 Tax=Anopheles culicifacies TaxID=139723 RepID=A0A182M060_9DIPT
MVTHMKPPLRRMYNVTQRLLIFAVLFLNSFIDLATIDGHVLPRPFANTTSSTPVRNFSTAGSDNIAPITTTSGRLTPDDVSGLSTADTHSFHERVTDASPTARPITRASTDNQKTWEGTALSGDMLNNTAGRVLVVAPENFSIDQLRQGFHNFVKLLQTNRPSPVAVSDTDTDNLTLSHFDKLIQFRSWRDMVTFERWLDDPAFGTVLYMSDESDSFIGYCDSLSTHLSTVYRKLVLFWPCPRMEAALPKGQDELYP